MGYVFCMGPCIGCGNYFSFNPDRVPSVRLNGVREPICKICVETSNPLREEKGMDPITILPGAYDPADEHEISW